MEQFGKATVMVGVFITAIGGVVWGLGRLFPSFRPGRLPGDIAIEKPGMSFYFPITTMILVSALLSLIVWLIGVLRR